MKFKEVLHVVWLIVLHLLVGVTAGWLSWAFFTTTAGMENTLALIFGSILGFAAMCLTRVFASMQNTGFDIF